MATHKISGTLEGNWSQYSKAATMNKYKKYAFDNCMAAIKLGELDKSFTYFHLLALSLELIFKYELVCTDFEKYSKREAYDKKGHDLEHLYNLLFQAGRLEISESDNSKLTLLNNAYKTMRLRYPALIHLLVDERKILINEEVGEFAIDFVTNYVGYKP